MNCNYNYILALDPSGNFLEGKGTTGWVLLTHDEQLLAAGYISAKNYTCEEEYWEAHIQLIKEIHKEYKKKLILVIEDYILYKSKSRSQINSKMETCRLLGVIQHYCWKTKLHYTLQLASSVKQRWSDDVLIYEKIIKRKYGILLHRQSGISLNLEHIRDAFRHAIHYAVCRNQTKKQRKRRNAKHKQSNY